MKTTIISKILLTLGLVFVLGSTVTSVHGGTQASSDSETASMDQQLPVVTISNVITSGVTGTPGVVARGQIGAFVLTLKPQVLLATTFVNFKVNGTAIQGVDFTPVISPASIGQNGSGVILVKTLQRASIVQAASVVVTLEPGPGYVVGQPSSAKLLIAP